MWVEEDAQTRVQRAKGVKFGTVPARRRTVVYTFWTLADMVGLCVLCRAATLSLWFVCVVPFKNDVKCY